MTARRTAQYVIAQAGYREPRVPPIAELEVLAREYLAVTGDSLRLGDSGAVFVSLTAAEEFARAEGLQLEEARRELTELLIDAKPVAGDETQWRARNRSSGLDITCRVARDGRLMVVTRVHVRPANVGGRRG